jgi:hypothetical protein
MNELFILIECEMSAHYYDNVKNLEKEKMKDQDNKKIELSS